MPGQIQLQFNSFTLGAEGHGVCALAHMQGGTAGMGGDTDVVCACLAEIPARLDAGKVGLYGISYGGVTAIYCTALEPSVKTAVFVSSPGSGSDFMASLRNKKDWCVFREEIGIDRIRRA